MLTSVQKPFCRFCWLQTTCTTYSPWRSHHTLQNIRQSGKERGSARATFHALCRISLLSGKVSLNELAAGVSKVVEDIGDVLTDVDLPVWVRDLVNNFHAQLVFGSAVI
jgi:hypothetical protein